MTPTENIKVKLIKIEDTGSNVVSLSRGTWSIDGKEYTIDSYQNQEVMVLNPELMKFKKTTTFKDHYVDDTGNNQITVDDYDDQFKALVSKGYPDDDEPYDYGFHNIDDEYAFKKFTRKWKCVYGTKVEWLDVDIQESLVTFKTDNPYIESLFATSKLEHEDSLLYTYNRKTAIANIICDCFKSLGMEFKEGLSHGATSNQKVWSRSSHSFYRYTVAFGEYVFNDKNMSNGYSSVKGTLKHCKAMYADDKKKYEGIIKSAYAAHFIREPISELLTANVLNSIRGISSKISSMQVKQKSESDLRTCKTEIAKLIKVLEESLASETDREGTQ